MEKIPIGTITKPHGIKGSVRVKTDSDFKASRYKVGNTLYIKHKNTYQSVTIAGFFEKGTLDVLTFEEFSDAQAVEKFRNATLYIDESSREPLEDDAFYYDDLIGLNVYLANQLIGSVKEVLDMPQAAMLRIDMGDNQTKLVPFLKVYVEAVDMAEKTITLKEVEGLL